jgi:uncharacterized protein (TIGR03032 family)
MQLPQPFIRLALTADADRLQFEIAQFGPDAWRAHPQGIPGNSALPFIARRGQADDDGVAGPMAPTSHLARCPYLRQVLAALKAPLGRTRLMRLDAGAEATSHVDTNYYWSQRVRVHIPVVTSPGVRFRCGDAETHMASGEVWIFDTWRPHNVINPAGTQRIHLVIDTVGSDAFWALAGDVGESPMWIPYSPGTDPSLSMETVNFPVVMSPYEFGKIWTGWCTDAAAADAGARSAIDAAVRRIQFDWRANWAAHGDAPEGWANYAALIQRLREISSRYAGTVKLANGQDLARLIDLSLIPSLHTPDLAARGVGAASVPDLGQVPSKDAKDMIAAAVPAAKATAGRSATPSVARPLIILCAPRSGSTLLFERLSACSPDWYTVGQESHLQFEGIAALMPANRGFDSNVLSSADATPEITADLRARFLIALRDRDGRLAPAGGLMRLLEKTPKNALRVPFLRAVFPDARFLYLWREPEECLASLIEGWQSGKFVTYPDLPGWQGLPWSYLLVPGWRRLSGRSLEEIVAAQWRTTQEQLLRDMADIAPEDIRALDLADFLAEPERQLRAICDFAGVTFDRPPPADMPLSLHTLTPPAAGKWRRHEDKLVPLLPTLMPIASQARAFVAARKLVLPLGDPQPIPAPGASVSLESALHLVNGVAAPVTKDPTSDDPGLGSVHTDNLPEILRQLGVSLFVTNYQGGKLIVVRPDGNTVNTHFLDFDKPMGLAVDANRLFVGTQTGVREFRNVPDVAKRLTPPNRNDAVYVFRNYYVTGNVDIHEIALGTDNECWFVNTRFSCLCTVDHEHSFQPRWRPRFITGLSPDDRCHLNGIAMMNGQPRWLTSLGATDTPEGWRANKANGGVLLDYESRDVVAHGLAMPHSPRWYRNRLWLLESSRGNLATVDPRSGKVESVARVPGFARGLDFAGPLAFIGISQLRDTNTFVDIQHNDDNADHRSGIWVVNIETGETIAILKFGEAVLETFAVQTLPGFLFPEILDEANEVTHTTYLLPTEAIKEVRKATPETTS